jgi:small subunit ribosomal protein S2
MAEQPTFTMRQLMEAGVHFGHHTRRWNPKMASYLFGVRNNVHIIDLEQTVPLFYRALNAITSVVSQGGRVLFVGTKHQAQEIVAKAAKQCGQYYVNSRWLGGTLTNWKTISNSIKRLRDIETQMADQAAKLTKKELLQMARERAKLENALGGIKDMGGVPDIMFVVDTNKEDIAVKEAQKLKIPVVAILDSNSDPSGIAYPIPGNDDAIRSIQTYCDLVAASVLAGLQREAIASGADIGASANPGKPVANDAAEPAKAATA